MRQKERHIDLSPFASSGETVSKGKGGRLARFAGRIVSFANLLPPRDAHRSAIPCRCRPHHRPCAGRLDIERDAPAGRVRWRCPVCRDSGVITGWRGTRWDLTAQLQSGKVISLFQAQSERDHKLLKGQRVKVFDFDVELVGGPIALDERVSRRLRVSGDKTLHELHELVRSAFEWSEDEPYEFLFGAPYDPEARRFTGGIDSADLEDELSETHMITLDSLDLKEGQSFGYLFDFGEEWVHRLTACAIGETMGYRARSRVLRRIGAPLPQHPEGDEHWDDDALWAELDQDYPMTDLYGPYVPDETPDPELWLAMEELEQLLLVIEAHGQAGANTDGAIESMPLHAMVHCLAERKLAEGDRTASSLMVKSAREGLSRHQAIHELGERLARSLLRKPPAAPSRIAKSGDTAKPPQPRGKTGR